MNGQSFFGLIVLSTIATLAVLWILPPWGSFAVNAKIVNPSQQLSPGWTHS